MKKFLLIIFFWVFIYSFGYSQVGIGAGGGLHYPGFSSSDNGNSKFNIGAGWDVFVRHRLIKINEDIIFHARYSVSNYFSDIELVSIGNTRYYFSYLSVEILTPIKKINSFSIVGGAGINLISITAVQKYTEDTNESLFIPSILIGAEYWLNQNYNIFGNINFQFGEFEDNEQNLPVNGLRFQVGATMFLTE